MTAPAGYYPPPIIRKRPDEENELSSPAVQPGVADLYGQTPTPYAPPSSMFDGGLAGFIKRKTAPDTRPSVSGAGMYDPSRGDVRQFSADGKDDLGANNGFNQANIWQGWSDQLTRQRTQQGTDRTRADSTRADADAAINNRPTMPNEPGVADYIAPEWDGGPTAPEAYRGPGARPTLTSDTDLLESISRFSGAAGGIPAPVGSENVAGGGAAFERYAQGAQGQFMKTLGQFNRGATDNAAARGRLKTGFFEEDIGRGQREISSDFQDNLLAHALEAASLDQQAATGNADRSLRAGQTNAANTLQNNQFLLNFAGNRANNRDNLTQAGYEDDRDFGYGVNRDMRGDFEGDRDFSRGVFMDDRDTGRGNFENDRNAAEDVYRNRRDFAQDQYTDNRDFMEGRREWDENEADETDQTYLDLLASTRDWRTQAGQQAKIDKANSGIGGFLKNTLLPVAGAASKFL